MSWNFHEFDMNISWTLSVEMWSWYSYEINGSNSLGHFHDHFKRKTFMKFSWIWYECFMNPLSRNMIMIFICNQWEQFIWVFACLFHDKNTHEIFMNLIWMFHEPFRYKNDYDNHMKSMGALYLDIFMLIS